MSMPFSGCAPTTTITVTLDLGGFDLDSEVEAFEAAACAVRGQEACAVLSAIAGVPYSLVGGPLGQPVFPDEFAATVTVPSLRGEIEVRSWFLEALRRRAQTGICEEAPGRAACALGGRHRISLASVDVDDFDPALLSDTRIERAAVVRDENDSLELPPFQVFMGHDGTAPALLAESAPFDIGGVALLDTDRDAPAMMAEALGAGDAFVEFGTIDGAVPGLVAVDDAGDRLRRPVGAMRLSLVVHLEVPLTTVATAAAMDR